MKNTFEEKVLQWTKQRDLLRRQMEQLNRDLEIIEVKLQAARELSPKQNGHVTEQEKLDEMETGLSTLQLLQSPDVSIGQAFIEAMKSLKRFTKFDLYDWIQSKYPNLKFSQRSYQRPLRDLMAHQLVVLIKKNQGNVQPSVYEYRGK